MRQRGAQEGIDIPEVISAAVEAMDDRRANRLAIGNLLLRT